MTNPLYLRLERAKKIQHVMARLGVEPDGWYGDDIKEDNPYEDYYIAYSVGIRLYTALDLLEKEWLEDGVPNGNYEITMNEYPAVAPLVLPHLLPTWRLDKLLNVLPEWVMHSAYNNSACAKKYGYDHVDIKAIDKIANLRSELKYLRGQEALDAVSELICLLDENGLLEEKKDE